MYQNVNILKIERTENSKRKCIFHTSLHVKGNITLEAAYLMPLFLVFVMSLAGLFSCMTFEMEMRKAVSETAEELICTGFEGSIIPKQLVLEKLSDRVKTFRGLVDGTRGLSFSGSYTNPMTGEMVLTVRYKLKLPGGSIFPFRFQMETCVHRQMLYGRAGTSAENADGTSVYLTKSGSVYHTHADCSYLVVHTKSVLRAQISTERNLSGGKYQPCRKCHGKDAAVVYISDYGELYHGDPACRYIKREVRSVPLSEIPGVPKCRRCSARDGEE